MIGKKLVIVSHTSHIKTRDNQLYGWGPTVEEINYLSLFFEEIVHVSCYEGIGVVPNSYRNYVNKNVSFAPIPTFGGTSILKKLGILFIMPIVLKQVESALYQASHVQLRVPMGIGLFLIPYFSIRRRNFIFWIKYANNWGDTSPKLGFRLQRYMLKQNWTRCKVTINGNWPNQAPHCLTFENPCLYENEILTLEKISKTKSYVPPFKGLFVGRMEYEKGVSVILEWLSKCDLTKIEQITFVGSGKDFKKLLNLVHVLGLNSKVSFKGPLSREEIHKLYIEHQFFLFPSKASEGFPKVVAEAMGFGCIPVTSEVSSLKEFLQKSGAGISWKDFISEKVENIKITDRIIVNGLNIAYRFSFENYIKRLKREVFN